MKRKVEMYGHDVELMPVPDGQVVTDVIVIARSVWYTEEGWARDSLLISTTRGVSGTIYTGMMSQALDYEGDDDEA